jgi:hypothetical protein
MAESLKEQESALRKALATLTHRHLSMAFQKGKFEAAEMARQQYALQGGVKWMLNRQLSMALRSGSLKLSQ